MILLKNISELIEIQVFWSHLQLKAWRWNYSYINARESEGLNSTSSNGPIQHLQLKAWRWNCSARESKGLNSTSSNPIQHQIQNRLIHLWRRVSGVKCLDYSSFTNSSNKPGSVSGNRGEDTVNFNHRLPNQRNKAMGQQTSLDEPNKTQQREQNTRFENPDICKRHIHHSSQWLRHNMTRQL